MTEFELIQEYGRTEKKIKEMPDTTEGARWLKCMLAQITDTIRRCRCTARCGMSRQEFVDRWQRKLIFYAQEIGLK